MPNPSLQIIRGIPFNITPWNKAERIEETLDYTPHDGDIVLASYPKTGSTLMQFILQQIVSKGEVLPSFEDIMTESMPFIEMTGLEAVERMKPPRIYRHHYPYHAVSQNRNAKYLYIYRNPTDAFVSRFHFMKQLYPEIKNLDEFFEDYISGEIAYGRIFEHVRSYWDHRNEDNMLILSYEKLVEDRKGEIMKIAEFLGEEYHRSLSGDGGRILELILERTEFDFMKKNISVKNPVSSSTEIIELSFGLGPKSINFFRMGTTGDGEKTLSEDQLKRLKAVAEEVMKGTDLMREWFQE